MSFIFETRNINKTNYLKIARRYMALQFGWDKWIEYNEKFDTYVVPVEASDKYRKMYGLTQWNTSNQIPWGFTQPPNIESNVEQKGRVFWFVNDTRNPFIIRQNAEKGLHEFAHAGCWLRYKKERRVRKFDDPQAKAGTKGPTYVTLVHDVAYGYRDLFTFWIRFGFMWLPIKGLDVRKHF